MAREIPGAARIERPRGALLRAGRLGITSRQDRHHQRRHHQLLYGSHDGDRSGSR